MRIRPVVTQVDVPIQDSEFLRSRLVIDDLFQSNEVTWVQSHHDRILLGGIVLEGAKINLEAPADFGTDYLLERREVGIACLSGAVSVVADGVTFELGEEDILYLGCGTRSVTLSGKGILYLSSSMSHRILPAKLIKRSEAETVVIGDQKNASERTLRKYIHDNGAPSSSMAMGITTLHEGNVWNTMPCHVHERRTEAYLYFHIPEDHCVVHLFGEPSKSRSVILRNLQAVISPAWSIHTGAGTSSYKFVWSTAGENITYSDFTPVTTSSLI